MGNKVSNINRAVEEGGTRRRSFRRKKNVLKCEYDYVFSDEDPRSWLPTDLTKSKLDLLGDKLCPEAPPPTHTSNPLPKSPTPPSQVVLNGSRQTEMAPFAFKRSRGEHPEGLGTLSKNSFPSLLFLSKSVSSSTSGERPPAKMAQGDPYSVEELNKCDKKYKPAWLPEVKPSDAKTNLRPDSSGIVKRSKSFFGFKLKRSFSKDRKATGESKSLEKIDQTTASLSMHKSGESILQKWRRACKSENDAVLPVPADETFPEPEIVGTSDTSFYTYETGYSYSSYSYESPDKPPDTPKKPPKRGPEKPPAPPRKDSAKKPPQPPKKPRPIQSQNDIAESPQDGGESGGSRGGSSPSYGTSPRGQGGKITPNSGSGSPVYSAYSSGNASPGGKGGRGPPKKRPPPPPVFISNCCGGSSSKKSAASPADRLENVDIVEELTYCCPTEGGGSNGGGGCCGNSNCKCCCCDYYSCCNDCGECQLVPNSCCCTTNNNSNPVKYCRRQRFNFNDGKKRSDDCCDGPPFIWQDRPPNPFDEIPVGKNPVVTCCACEDPCTENGPGKVLPSESGTYFYDAERRSFVPVLEIEEAPDTPQQEIQDEIIDEEPVLTNIEPIIQPMMQPMGGGCCPMPPFCGIMGQPCFVNPCGNDGNERDDKKGMSKSSKNSENNSKESPNCMTTGMMGLCGMNMPGLANMGPYGSLVVPQFNYQTPPCPPCNPCCPCPPEYPCCPAGEQSPCCPCPPCQPMSCAPICFPPYGGYPMCCQGCNKKKKKKKDKKKKGNEKDTQYSISNNTGTNTNAAYDGGGSDDYDE